MSIYSHRLLSRGKTINCWTLVSDGLLPVGQKEIVFTVQREVEEHDRDYPRQLVNLYSTFHFLAMQGRTVDVGGFTSTTSASGLVGRPDFSDIIYSLPCLPGVVDATQDCLTAIIVTREECQLAQEYGVVRMTTLLGNEYRFFPYAPWADRKRGQLATLTSMENSILNKVRRMKVLGTVVYLAGEPVSVEHVGATFGLADRKIQYRDQRVVLELRVSAHRMVSEMIAEVPDDAPFAMLSTPDPLADALLHWTPGSMEPRSICADKARGERIGGNFPDFRARTA